MSTTRSDIATAVSVLSRYTGKVCTSSYIGAIRKVLRYVVCTAREGLYYSPRSEKEFKNVYQNLLKDPPQSFPAKHLFSDASYASCFLTLRSTSGGIVYFRSFPICWRTKRQTVTCFSTSESEYVACSDVIVLGMENRFLNFFNRGDEVVDHDTDEVIWVDNQSAVAVAKADEVRPRSRHYALRWTRVREEGRKIQFCPTRLQKADGLTKVCTSIAARHMILHHVEQRGNTNIDDWREQEDESIGLYARVFGPGEEFLGFLVI